jgi:predicted DNA-binding protein
MMVKITQPLDPKLKALLDAYCERTGRKQQAVVSAAIASWLEDAEDLAVVEERRAGPWLSWDEVKASLDL